MKKNAEASEQFKATFPTRLQQVATAHPTRKVLVWAYDESRFGLHTIRRLTARGIKPQGTHQHRFENVWLYGVVAPQTGDGYFHLLLDLKTSSVQTFLDGFAAAHPTTLNVLLLDNSRAHTSRTLVVPANVVLIFQPPYSPELNPAERVWLDLKTDLAWHCWTDLLDLQAHIARLVKAYDRPTLQTLTGYPYLMAAINALSP